MKRILFVLLSLLIIPAICIPVLAHPGKTDSNGGHTDHSTGDYHYHHGQPAHEHYDMNGDGTVDCPYDFVEIERNITSSSSSSKNNHIPSKPQPESTETPDDSVHPLLVLYVFYCAIASLSGFILFFLSDHYEGTAQNNTAKKLSRSASFFTWTSIPWSFIPFVAAAILYEAFLTVSWMFRLLQKRK